MKTAPVAVSADINVGMDEVVAVFVSQYETNLFDRKDELSDQIKRAKTALSALDDALIGGVDQTQYAMQNSVLGISSEVTEISVSWESTPKRVPSVRVQVEVQDDDDQSRYSSSFHKVFKIEVSKKDIEDHERLTDELTDLTGELSNVMGLIKSVSRKERQIRGQISAKKLQEAGAESLLSDPSILALVQL